MQPQDERTAESADAGRRRQGRGRVPWRWIALGLALGLAAGLLLARKPGAPLTPERLAEARARWQAHRPVDYELEIQMRGAVRDLRRIEVRDGEVVEMTTGGAPVPREAWSYWTVDGLFEFLEDELDNASRPAEAYGVDDPRRVVVRVAFDRRWGYPSFFLRHVLGRGQSVEWTVTSFEAE